MAEQSPGQTPEEVGLERRQAARERFRVGLEAEEERMDAQRLSTVDRQLSEYAQGTEHIGEQMLELERTLENLSSRGLDNETDRSFARKAYEDVVHLYDILNDQKIDIESIRDNEHIPQDRRNTARQVLQASHFNVIMIGRLFGEIEKKYRPDSKFTRTEATPAPPPFAEGDDYEKQVLEASTGLKSIEMLLDAKPLDERGRMSMLEEIDRYDQIAQRLEYPPLHERAMKLREKLAGMENAERLTAEQYDEEVRKLFDGVGAIESQLNLFAKKNALNEETLAEFHGQLDQYDGKLRELDARRADGTPSRERNALAGLIKRIRDEYPPTMKMVPPREVAAPGSPARLSLGSVRDLRRRVKAAYADISHTLSEDKRKAYRARIALMSALIEHAQSAQEEVVINLASRSRDYFKSPAFVHAAASLAIARAHSTAPAIASAIPAAAPRKAGLLAVLGDAFKLK